MGGDPGHEFERMDAESILQNSWRNLRLSVRCPSRVPTWDAILLTAASPEQAQLYQMHLERAKTLERISSATIVLAVPDPEGRRIGSGGATLAALRALGKLLQTQSSLNKDASWSSLAGMKILLLHAGGDSKRLPWANAIGKIFLPIPFLAEEDPDGPVPLLIDHILAISSHAVQPFKEAGGLFIMTGDVLPCFNASNINLPENGAIVVTVPATVDIARRHGVILPCKKGKISPVLVDDLLQKPTEEELVKKGAVDINSNALLDTGIFAVRGCAWYDLLSLALADLDPVNLLLTNGEEISLYEELAGAWVPACHEWVKTRALGNMVLEFLGSQRLFHFCSNTLKFLHFGTSEEILHHFENGTAGLVARKHLCSIDSVTPEVSSSAFLLSSKIFAGTTVGSGSLIYNCTLNATINVGSRCIIMGIHLAEHPDKHDYMVSTKMILPDHSCLWEVPLKNTSNRVILCCGIKDNPKVSYKKGGTYFGASWDNFMATHGISKQDLWAQDASGQGDLWSAKLFPILPSGKGYCIATWLMQTSIVGGHDLLKAWRNSERLSFCDLHNYVDFECLYLEGRTHEAKIAASVANSCLLSGLLEKNIARLTTQVLLCGRDGTKICKELLSTYAAMKDCTLVPASRHIQVQVDLYKACGDEVLANVHEKNVWQAVASQTAAAVGQLNGFHIPNGLAQDIIMIKSSTVHLPVRVDFVGGWSDTPPWSLENNGCVLNMAILLHGTKPVGAQVDVVDRKGVSITDDMGNRTYIRDFSLLSHPSSDDLFRLVKAALIVTGFSNSSLECGLDIKTWANVPQGSGLGTSSILAAAVVKALLQIRGKEEGNEHVTHLVLLLEQLMGTGGGWQDQVGGIYPGVKLSMSFPGEPLMLNVLAVPLSTHVVAKLEERLLLIFTGKVRLAQTVLQKVVRRYLQRDAILISAIRRLAQLAEIGRAALSEGNFEHLGNIMLEAWQLHQELDPFCSNTFVDMLFRTVAPFAYGYKLVGAGGGGFAMIMAKDRDAAISIKALLSSYHPGIVVYNWSVYQEN